MSFTACYRGHNSLDQLPVIPIPNPYHSDCYSIQMSDAGTKMPDSILHAHSMSTVDTLLQYESVAMQAPYLLRLRYFSLPRGKTCLSRYGHG